MPARWIRRGVIAICVAGIAGMIMSSIADSTGGATTFGLVTAAAVVSLILVTSVAAPGSFGPPPPVDERAAADVEARVVQLVHAGADETDVRALVRAVHRMSRSR